MKKYKIKLIMANKIQIYHKILSLGNYKLSIEEFNKMWFLLSEIISAIFLAYSILRTSKYAAIIYINYMGFFVLQGRLTILI